MVHLIIRKATLITGIAAIALLSSCYYDNVEELYPQSPDCDTTNISYATDIFPVIDANCIACHSGSAPSGNVSLSNYSEILAASQNGSLLGTIKHEPGWSPMPKNGNKLDDCTISKLEVWVAVGSPDN